MDRIARMSLVIITFHSFQMDITPCRYTRNRLAVTLSVHGATLPRPNHYNIYFHSYPLGPSSQQQLIDELIQLLTARVFVGKLLSIC